MAMGKRRVSRFVTCGLLVVTMLLAADNSTEANSAPAAVDEKRLVAADSEPGEWMSTGRTYDEQHFSPLDLINVNTIELLHLAAFYDVPTRFGQEATPLVVDGTMYIATDQSIVKALDATTGRELWSYDPAAASALAENCCAGVNRGVAVWRSKVFVGALDGRLIALDAATGKVVWETLTVDKKYFYTITGAPRVIRGKVLIGNGGAEFGGVRGYVSAYDADTGRMVWRFYTVPGAPNSIDNAISDRPLQERAIKTWAGQWWKSGGGGTVWDSMAYDPKLGLLYIGTGNGDPWNHGMRSAGRGDNLFLASIVALRADTGEYAWHYQTTPGESWDFDATQPIILADLKMRAGTRRVLMQASKNGFFYILDRNTGELLSAKAIVPTTWASGVDLRTGRPIENPSARYYKTGRPFLMAPSGIGAHSWQPMSYSPLTGLVYIPVQQVAVAYMPNSGDRNTPMKIYTGTDFALNVSGNTLATRGWLEAWDPIAGKEVWRVPHNIPWSGGTLSTKGGLVFQGDADGKFSAFTADSGRRLWTFEAQTGIVAAPMSYMINGEQYVAVMAGWGGNVPLIGGSVTGELGPNRLLIFKLGGAAELPPKSEISRAPPILPTGVRSPATIAKGEKIYATYCSRCHGVAAISGGILPDLRYSTFLVSDSWFDVILKGALASKGMASFSSVIDEQGASAIRTYIVNQASSAPEP
jgi:quinohemoprotein ethanol dehydrogenase